MGEFKPYILRTFPPEITTTYNSYENDLAVRRCANRKRIANDTGYGYIHLFGYGFDQQRFMANRCQRKIQTENEIEDAFEKGQFEKLKELYEIYKSHLSGVGDRDGEALFWFCYRGNVNLVSWLCDECKFDKEFVQRTLEGINARTLFEKNRNDIFQFFFDKYGLKKDDVKIKSIKIPM